MAQRKPLFFAERLKIAERYKDATIADVMEQLASLRADINDIQNKTEVSGTTEKETAVVERAIAEVMSVNERISATKEEITALKTADEANTSISSATDELTEVVKTTEGAVNKILENAELIDAVVADLRSKIPVGDPDDIEPDVDKFESIGVELMTACSFQDITGQRIDKVVNALNFIEERLSKIVEIWNIEHESADKPAAVSAEGDAGKDKEMIDGPASDDTGGMSQDDIDKMFD